MTRAPSLQSIRAGTEFRAYDDVGMDMVKRTGKVEIPIKEDTDVLIARQKGREMAQELGFSPNAQVIISIALSEVAQNISVHAESGAIILVPVCANGQVGLSIIARDGGPGIPDITKALEDGYSTKGSLGLGLPGAKRLMDEFEICSNVGLGTVIRMKKWKA